MTTDNPAAIDAVITWVDNSDHHWRGSFNRFAQTSGDERFGPDGPQYRDGGLLKYCLRAIYQNMPWIGRIFLVTDGHFPKFLNIFSPRVQLVSHSEFFPEPDHLPTFNSMAIECHIHRISGLSDTFIYFNDDVFVLTPQKLSQFVTDDCGHILPFEDFPLPANLRSQQTVDRSLAFTNLLLSSRFGTNPKRRLIPHVPQPYDRRWIDYLWRIWPDALANTSTHRFRQTSSVALRALYYHTIHAWAPDAMPAFAEGRSYPLNMYRSPSYRFIWTRDGTNALRSALDLVDDLNSDFICLNDDTVDAGVAADQLSAAERWLECRFPNPPPWELA